MSGTRPMVERTEEEQAEVKRRFAARKRNQLLLVLPIVAVLAVFFVYRKNAPEIMLGMSRPAFQAVAVTIVLGALVFSWFNWRCPACNGYLGRSVLLLKYCGKCGAELK